MISKVFYKMEPIHPDEMVPETKYTMEDPAAASLAKLLTSVDEMVQKFTGESQCTNRPVKRYKTVTFKRVAYKLKGVWYYQFDVDGRKRYFTENDTFYKEA